MSQLSDDMFDIQLRVEDNLLGKLPAIGQTAPFITFKGVFCQPKDFTCDDYFCLSGQRSTNGKNDVTD